jgi:hypothetical protein
MCRLTGLRTLNMGAFLTLFYTPVVSETRSRPQAGTLFRASPNPASASTSSRPR